MMKKGKQGLVMVLMGVSATGKTTLGEALALASGGDFYDGDDFHPEENRQKMAQGQALSDLDRKPWLEALADFIEECSSKAAPSFIACSALKASYRAILASKYEDLEWIFLHAPTELLRERITKRYQSGEHFMPPSLLDSQLATLQEPDDALRLDVSESIEDLVEQYFIWKQS